MKKILIGFLVVLVLFLVYSVFWYNFYYLNKMNDKLVYAGTQERNFLKQMVVDISKNITYQDYLNLVKGLDKSSKNIVDNTLQRASLVASIDATEAAVVYSNRDCNEIIRINNDFVKNLKKDKNGNFIYKNYIFPIKPTEKNVLIYRHFVDEIKNKNDLENKNIIDAGAYMGSSAVILSEYTNKKVYSFEPVKYNYDLLLKTIKLNNLTNVVPVQMGLGDKIETQKVYFSASIPSAASIKYDFAGKSEKEQIKITTLDKYVSENNIQVGLIKSDIEGFEQNLLRGAEKTIKTQKPVLILSIYHSADDFFHIKTMIESWNLGYKFRIVKSAPEAMIFETLLIAEIK